MLLLTANGLEPGEESRGRRFPLAVQVGVTVLAAAPVSTVEVVANSEIHRVNIAADPASAYTYKGRDHLTLRDSSWIAARWVSPEVTVATSPIPLRSTSGTRTGRCHSIGGMQSCC